MTTTITPESMAARWADPKARPLFKGKLIDADGCCCAQGDALRCAGWTDDDLRGIAQQYADRKVAKLLGISIFHAILLRNVNDSDDGQPQRCILAEQVPEYGEELLGPMHAELFAFGHELDRVTPEQWSGAVAAGNSAEDAAWVAAGAAAGNSAMHAAMHAARARAATAWDAAWVAAGNSAWALCVRDLIGKHGFTQAHYDTLTAPLRKAGITVHPDDAPMTGGAA
jgi:hypothetical protein